MRSVSSASSSEEETTVVALTGKQKRSLRAVGHHLSVVVQVGSEGVTEGVVGAVTQALIDHELVKIQINDERDARDVAAQKLASETGGEIAQQLGKTLLLFKQRKEKSKIKI